MSAPVTGPNPVPHNVITWPGCAVMVGELIGWTFAETKFCRMPGPRPVPFAVKMPKALVTIRTVEGLLVKFPETTRRVAMPKGALEGMMALICESLAKRGIALTLEPPCVTVMETLASEVPSGNELALAGEAGPRRVPKIEKMEPCAMAPPGTPGGMKLAALTTARL